MSQCQVKTIIQAIHTLEGGGFSVRRPFPTQSFSEWDPFLLIDELGPVDWAPNAAIGAPAHPHRGFETISYVLEGHLIHRDSMGQSGELRSGDIQWMTAGSGIVHEELPHPDFAASGGTMHAFQIWLNLPPALKMRPPQYQQCAQADIPRVVLPDGAGQLAIISGHFYATQGAFQPDSGVQFMDITLHSGQGISLPTTPLARNLLYVFQGAAESQENLATSGQLMIFDSGDTVSFSATGSTSLRALYFSGKPFGATIARYGPFVMNTHAELIQAFSDYQSGKMGQLS